MDKLLTLKTVTLRKMAKDKNIPGFEQLDRKQLLSALAPAGDNGGEGAASGKANQAPKGPKNGEGAASAGNEHIQEGHIPVGSKAETMKKICDEAPKVQVYIPLVGSEKKGTTLPVTINGYRVNITKGVYVSVPKPIADVLKESLNQTSEAFERAREAAGKIDGK